MLCLLSIHSASWRYINCESEEQSKHHIGKQNIVLAKFYKSGIEGKEISEILNQTARLFGNATVLNINCMTYENSMLCYNHEIMKYPSVLVFPPKSQLPRRFEEYPSLQTMVDFVAKVSRKQPKEWPPQVLSILTPESIEEFKNARNCASILYYDPMCRHCRSFLPAYVKADNIFKHDSKANVGMLNCVEHHEYCQDLNITYWPQVFTYKDGANESYTGERDISSFVSYINQKCGTQRKDSGLFLDDYGIIPEAVPYVEEFFMSDKNSIIEKMKSVNNSQIYVEIMQNISSTGNSYIQERISEINEKLSDNKIEPSLRDSLSIELNVYNLFDAKREKADRAEL